jgi:hypothetical protein
MGSRQTVSVEGADVAGFVTLATGTHFELHLLTLLQGLEPRGLDLGEVHEDIGPVLTGDESVSLFRIEKLHCAERHGGTHFSLEPSIVPSDTTLCHE